MKADESIATNDIHKALKSDNWTEAEKCVIRWQFRLYGSFYFQLFEAIQLADYLNIEKLRKGFPNEVEGFLAWRDGDLGNKIDNLIGL